MTKVRAVYTAALKAHLIADNPKDTWTNKKTVEAICKINELYNRI